MPEDRNEDEYKPVLGINLDKVEVYSTPSGLRRVSPFIIIKVGGEDVEGTTIDHAHEVYKYIKDKVHVPVLVVSNIVEVYTVGEY